MNKKYALIVIILLIIVVYFSLFVMSILIPQRIGPGLAPPETRCLSIAEYTCENTNELPTKWGVEEIVPEAGGKTCEELLECSSCSECGF